VGAVEGEGVGVTEGEWVVGAKDGPDGVYVGAEDGKFVAYTMTVLVEKASCPT
jgi:hypothetical protein